MHCPKHELVSRVDARQLHALNIPRRKLAQIILVGDEGQGKRS